MVHLIHLPLWLMNMHVDSLYNLHRVLLRGVYAGCLVAVHGPGIDVQYKPCGGCYSDTYRGLTCQSYDLLLTRVGKKWREPDAVQLTSQSWCATQPTKRRENITVQSCYRQSLGTHKYKQFWRPSSTISTRSACAHSQSYFGSTLSLLLRY